MSDAKFECPIGLQKLKDGNAKHVQHIKNKSGRKIKKIGVTKPGQTPYAAILSCADSRVVPENIFTAKEGDLFVVRVAGNIANTSSIASLEYAVEHLGVRVIAVLGHESCGAVEAAIMQAQQRVDFGPNLNALLAHIVPAINGKCPINNLKDAVVRNAKVSAKQLLEQSEILSLYYREHGLGIFDGYYNIYGEKSGKVSGIKKWKCPKVPKNK